MNLVLILILIAIAIIIKVSDNNNQFIGYAMGSEKDGNDMHETYECYYNTVTRQFSVNHLNNNKVYYDTDNVISNFKVCDDTLKKLSLDILVYTHFKGGEYIKLGNIDTDVVLYYSIQTNVLWIRSYESFSNCVESPTGVKMRRFKLESPMLDSIDLDSIVSSEICISKSMLSNLTSPIGIRNVETNTVIRKKYSQFNLINNCHISYRNNNILDGILDISII